MRRVAADAPMTTPRRWAGALLLMTAASAAQATPITLVNEGFEAPWTGIGTVGSDGAVTFNYRPSGPNVGWTFQGGGGVAASYSLISAYEGQRFGLLQLGNPADPFGSTGASFVQSFSLASNATVDLSFALALRPGYQPGQRVAVAVDGNVVHTFAATSTSWTLQSLSLGPLAAGTHQLGFAGLANYATYGDTTAYLDAVHLNAAAPVPEPETYALMLGGLSLLGWQMRRRAGACS